MQYSVLQFPLLQHLAGMLGHGKRHRGLQSRPLRSSATLPAVGRTPWLIARRGEALAMSRRRRSAAADYPLATPRYIGSHPGYQGIERRIAGKAESIVGAIAFRPFHLLDATEMAVAPPNDAGVHRPLCSCGVHKHASIGA
jgi:hypothetical protein